MQMETVRTLQKKRTTNFREDETKLLIQLWGSPQIQNKLYLTHRKAPVMRLLAANMQQRGFYRTPDEIKTRIRNLKCLYHRIKRTMACGTGIGTVDPDWPHFKAMDAILSKQTLKRDKIDETLLAGPKCEDIKQEIDIDINDDIDSWATNSLGGSEYEEEPSPVANATATPTAASKEPKKTPVQPFLAQKPMPAIIPSFTIPTQQNAVNGRQGTVPSIPLPLLILNSMQPQQSQQSAAQQDKKDNGVSSSSGAVAEKSSSGDVAGALKELLDVQRDHLELERQKLELEKQRLEFNRLVGTQLLTLLPMIGSLLQRVTFPGEQLEGASSIACNSDGQQLEKNGRKRQAGSDLDILKDSKILRTVLEQGIKKYMMGEDSLEERSENEDSGIQNDENSMESEK